MGILNLIDWDTQPSRWYLRLEYYSPPVDVFTPMLKTTGDVPTKGGAHVVKRAKRNSSCSSARSLQGMMEKMWESNTNRISCKYNDSYLVLFKLYIYTYMYINDYKHIYIYTIIIQSNTCIFLYLYIIQDRIWLMVVNMNAYYGM